MLNSEERVIHEQNSNYVIANGVLKNYSGKDSDITIPDGVSSIDSETFRKNSVLKKVFNSELEKNGPLAFVNVSILR